MYDNRYRSAHISAVVALALVIVCSGAGHARAQSGGDFSLTWNTAPGGGGASSGGQFSLQGTVSRQQTEPLQGGAFGLTPGYEQPECTAGAVQAVVDVVLALSESDLTLSWTHLPANGAYEVHRSSEPGFAPSSETLRDTIFAPQQVWPDEGAAGDPAANRYYVVRARCGGLWGDSNRTGAFSFALVVP